MNEPWICPRCKRVNAPFNPSCFCKPDDEISLSTGSEHINDAARYLNPDNLYKILEAEKKKADIARGMMPNFYNPVPMPDVMKKTKVNLPVFPCFICGAQHAAGFECATLSRNNLPPNGEFI